MSYIRKREGFNTKKEGNDAMGIQKGNWGVIEKRWKNPF